MNVPFGDLNHVMPGIVKNTESRVYRTPDGEDYFTYVQAGIEPVGVCKEADVMQYLRDIVKGFIASPPVSKNLRAANRTLLEATKDDPYDERTPMYIDYEVFGRHLKRKRYHDPQGHDEDEKRVIETLFVCSKSVAKRVKDFVDPDVVMSVIACTCKQSVKNELLKGLANRRVVVITDTLFKQLIHEYALDAGDAISVERLVDVRPNTATAHVDLHKPSKDGVRFTWRVQIPQGRFLRERENLGLDGVAGDGGQEGLDFDEYMSSTTPVCRRLSDSAMKFKVTAPLSSLIRLPPGRTLKYRVPDEHDKWRDANNFKMVSRVTSDAECLGFSLRVDRRRRSIIVNDLTNPTQSDVDHCPISLEKLDYKSPTLFTKCCGRAYMRSTLWDVARTRNVDGSEDGSEDGFTCPTCKKNQPVSDSTVMYVDTDRVEGVHPFIYTSEMQVEDAGVNAVVRLPGVDLREGELSRCVLKEIGRIIKTSENYLMRSDDKHMIAVIVDHIPLFQILNKALKSESYGKFVLWTSNDFLDKWDTTKARNTLVATHVIEVSCEFDSNTLIEDNRPLTRAGCEILRHTRDNPPWMTSIMG